MIKHVGKHNQRKVVVVYRMIPDEEHMALVSYTDALPSLLHDEVMKTLESDIGQQAKELADALFRTTMADGTNCLNSLHKGGLLKKVPCNQVIVTPTANSNVRLDELNDIMRKIEEGGDAAEQLENLDKTRGLRDPNQGRDVGEPAKAEPAVLSDAELAQQRIDQATQMEAEAQTLLAEAKRLKKEADSMLPKAKNVRKSKKVSA
jgi:hypothetical protein